jgi:transposase
VDDEAYVRRRHWSLEEKRTVVTEALSSRNVIATAKRRGIQAQQIYRWRERLDERPGPATFLAVSIAPAPCRSVRPRCWIGAAASAGWIREMTAPR